MMSVLGFGIFLVASLVPIVGYAWRRLMYEFNETFGPRNWDVGFDDRSL